MILAWVAAVAFLAIVVPPPDTSVGETADLLPSTTPVHIAWQQLSRHFGDASVLSEVVVVFEREDGKLSAEDVRAMETVAAQISAPAPNDPAAAEIKTMTLRTPATFRIAGADNPLLSEDGHAGLIYISLPYNFITKPAARVAAHVQKVVAASALPHGLAAEVTGSAGYGYDYAIATNRSHEKTTTVTLISVILILLLIYRAPLAALIPLGAIGMAALVERSLLAWGDRHGLHNGMAEQIFAFVLLYGAGVDYSLLFVSRYREFLDEGLPSREAVRLGLDASFVAIVSSTTMTVSGLIMLCFAHFSVFKFAGPAVVVALIVAAAAAVTLVPAVLAIIGPVAFWPGRRARKREKADAIIDVLKPATFDPAMPGGAVVLMESPAAATTAQSVVAAEAQASTHEPEATGGLARIWAAVADLVVRHPGPVIVLTLAALILPAARGLQLPWNYDALTSIKPSYPARHGTEIVQRHWSIGETAPVTLLVATDQPKDTASWRSASEAILKSAGAVPDIDNVRALSAPLGTHVSAARNLGVLMLAGPMVSREFLSDDHQAMRIYITLKEPPLTRTAMTEVAALASAARDSIAGTGLAAQVYVSGLTAEMTDIRTETQADFKRVAMLALAAIIVMVTAVLRDVMLSLFIVAATALSYLTTLGLTYWTFKTFGYTGLEWKVQMLLFIVLVAVGQDYSIFFAVRFAQEARTLSCAAATRRAVIATGPVISSCGLIMAATLGSIMAGDITVLVQLGFALALGMLIDTFVVRPLLLPAFIVLTRRTLHRAMAFIG